MIEEINPYNIIGTDKEIKDKNLDGFSSNRTMGDEYFEPGSKIQTLRLGVSNSKFMLLFYLLVLILMILFSRILFLQVAKGSHYQGVAEENRLRINVIKAPRGVMFDRDGNQLVKNIPNFTLFLTPADFPNDPADQERIINELSEILEEDLSIIKTVFDNAPSYSYDPIIIKEHIDYQKALVLEIKSSEYPGISLKTNSVREYLEGNYISHLIGYTGKITEDEFDELKDEDYLLSDYIGKIGLENYYEETLKGKNGKQKVEVNSQGKINKVTAQEESQAGLNLVLSLDLGLQKKLSDELAKAIERTKASGGAAVAMDPRNGEILGLVSLPDFDNNSFVKGISEEEYKRLIDDERKPLFNRAISGGYPPGSTFKPVVAAAALEEGVVDPSYQVNSTGGIKINKWFFPDWKSGGHGLTDVRKAIAESVNSYFYIVGGGDEEFTGLGVARIKEYAEIFGLNNELGIDIPGEKPGFLPSKEWKEETKNERWYIGDTYHLAIGQGDILVTPLQVASYTSTIANRGTLYTPHLLTGTLNSENEQIEIIQPQIIRDSFISRSNINAVAEGLRQAVLSGSSQSLNDLPFSAAGKTGTAQFGNEGKTHAWFTTFAPYESPEIVITVVVEGGGEGHLAALPVAKESMRWYFSHD